MASLNLHMIIGNIGRKDLRYTQSGQPVLNLRVATNEVYRKQDGSEVENTEWHTVVVWGKRGEGLAEYCTVGRPVFVKGKSKTKSWKDQATGAQRSATEIHVGGSDTDIQLLPFVPKAKDSTDSDGTESPSDEEPVSAAAESSVSSVKEEASFSDGEIPF